MLAGVHVEKKIRQRALQAGAPAFVDRESRAGDFRGGGEIENPGALADFPVGAWRKVECRRRAPAAHFDIVRALEPSGTLECGTLGMVSRNSRCVSSSCGDALVGLLDELRNLLHVRDDGVGGLLFFFEAGDFVARFVALRLALLVLGDQLAAFFVERAKSVEIQRGAALGAISANTSRWSRK